MIPAPVQDGRQTIEVEMDQFALGAPPESSAASTRHATDSAKPDKSSFNGRAAFTTAAAILLAAAGGLVCWRGFPLGLATRHTTLASSDTTPGAAAQPVRFANPFDSEEVFEFPAGTTDEAARDAVAEMLLKRAEERQLTDHKQSATLVTQRTER